MGPTFEKVPELYGTFHIISLIISFIVCILAFIFAKKRSDKKDAIVVFVVSLFLCSTEVWKQVTRIVANNGKYPFSIFPFQLCSIPMFLGLIPIFLKEGKVKDTIYKYITLTGILGGVTMLLVPMVIFTSYIYFTIHSIVWHLALTSQGIYLARSRKYGVNIAEDVVPTIPILAIVITIAVILNATPYGFNLISLSTRFVNEPAILDAIYQRVSYPIYVAIVFLGLTAGFFVLDFIFYLFRKLRGVKKHGN